MAPRLLLALAAIALATPTGLAFMADYQQLPTEHDDQGRSDEPDGESTGIFGGALVNCVVAFDATRTPGIGRACVPDPSLPAPRPGQARVLAPGCTGDDGRHLAGECALWSNGLHAGDTYVVEPGRHGERGMGDGRAPGAHTPSASTLLRLLDLQLVASAMVGFEDRYIDVSHKLQDRGVPPDTGGLTTIGSRFAPPSASLFAWYGTWQDLNGNGVIDHLADDQGRARGGNEFRWVGGCSDQVTGEVCIREPGLVFPFWMFPGDHHARCGFFVCVTQFPGDMPGRAVECMVVGAAGQSESFVCPHDADDPSVAGDPLLGAQHDLKPDALLIDATGVKEAAGRLWHAGLLPIYFYDQSLLVSLVVAGGPTLLGPDAGRVAGFDLAGLQFVDVDEYVSWTPVLEPLLLDTVKPAARSTWLLARDGQEPAQRTLDGQLHRKSLDAPTQGLAAYDDMLRDPGWSREPNTAQDSFPGARFDAFAPGPSLPAGEQRHRGWLIDDSGHRAGWHAWADLQARRVDFSYGYWRVQGQPVCCSTYGSGLFDSLSVLPTSGGFPRAAGDHARALEAGIYQFHGHVGVWRDQPQAMDEAVLDAATLGVRHDRYTLPADGWVGNIVNTTGTWHSRGYANDTCFLQGLAQLRAWGVCHPYLDSDVVSADANAGADQGFGVDLSDPQDYTDRVEFVPLVNPPATPPVVVLRPVGGVWDFPLLVWRDFYDWDASDTAAFQDLTGSTQPVVLRTLPRILQGRVVARDLLVLPSGAMADLTSELSVRVDLDAPSRGIAVDQVVRDVDAYRGVDVALLVP